MYLVFNELLLFVPEMDFGEIVFYFARVGSVFISVNFQDGNHEMILNLNFTCILVFHA